MKKIFALLLSSMMILSLVACGSTSETTTAAPKAETTTAAVETKVDPTTTAAETKVDAASLKYAVLLKPLSNEYWTIMKNGIEAWAKEKNFVVDVYAAESEENIAGQLSQLEDIISKDYAGIAVAPLTPVNLISGIVKANEKGIPVVNVDEPVDAAALKQSGGAMIALVTTDNKLVGKTAGEFIMEKIGSGKVAIIEGTSGNITSQNRSSGAAEAIKAGGGEVVASQPGDWDRIKSLDVAANLIQSNPDLKAFYCANDTMALGVLQAVQNANKTDQIIVIGTDAIAGAKESVDAGELTATVGQDNVGIAIRCLELLMEAVDDGWKADTTVDMPTEYIDSFLVTKDNVADYLN